MPLLTPELLNSQQTALEALLTQVLAQITSLTQQLTHAKAHVGLLQGQLETAQAAAEALQGQIGELTVAQASAAIVDGMTLAQYTWTQDPATQAWTGIPVQYPGVPHSNIAVFGGTGAIPVLQPNTPL